MDHSWQRVDLQCKPVHETIFFVDDEKRDGMPPRSQKFKDSEEMHTDGLGKLSVCSQYIKMLNQGAVLDRRSYHFLRHTIDPWTHNGALYFFRQPQQLLGAGQKMKYQAGALDYILERQGNTVSALVVMTPQYPNTVLKRAGWSRPNTSPDTLLFLQATIRGSSLHIQYFYSKAAEDALWDKVSAEEKPIVRNVGQHLVCAMLRTLPEVETVALSAYGGFPWERVANLAKAEAMSTDDLSLYLRKTLTEFDITEHLGKDEQINLESLKTAYMQVKSNCSLAEYYKKTFGFKAQEVSELGITMRATRETILSHCDLTNHKRIASDAGGDKEGHKRKKMAM